MPFVHFSAFPSPISSTPRLSDMTSFPSQSLPPTFTTQDDYSIRLPAYRSSHLIRYHPYGRYTPTLYNVLRRTAGQHCNHTVGCSCARDYSATHSPSNRDISTDEDGAAVKSLRDAFFPGGSNRTSDLNILVVDLALIVARKLQKMRLSSLEKPPTSCHNL